MRRTEKLVDSVVCVNNSLRGSGGPHALEGFIITAIFQQANYYRVYVFFAHLLLILYAL